MLQIANKTPKSSPSQRLTWKSVTEPYPADSNFNKKYPKYFGKQSFDFKILKSNPTFAKLKRLKIVNRLAIAEMKFLENLQKSPFHRHQVKTLLRVHSKHVRDYSNGTVTPMGRSLTFLPHVAFVEDTSRLEFFSFCSKNLLAAKALAGFRSLKYLSISASGIGNMIPNPKEKKYLERMFNAISTFPNLKAINISNLFSSDHWVVPFLDLFHKSAKNFRQGVTLTLDLHQPLDCPSDLAGQPEPPLLILSKVTHLKVEKPSLFLLRRLEEFKNLSVLEITFHLNRAAKGLGLLAKKEDPKEVDFEEVICFFSEFPKLKTLKSLSMIIGLKPDASSDNMQTLLNCFNIPESLEHLSLAFAQTPWHLILPYPQRENNAEFLDTNPILESSEFKGFLSNFERLENLRSLCLTLADKKEIGYAMNKHLGFAILRKIPKLFELNYQAKNVGFSKGVKNIGLLNDVKNIGPSQDVFPPTDLFKFFESIQHHLPHLTSLVIGETEASLTQSLSKLPIQMPNLKTFVLGCDKITGNEALCELPRLITNGGNKDLQIFISKIAIKEDNYFIELLKSLRNLPPNSKTLIRIEPSSISQTLLEEQILTFIKEMRNENSVILALCAQNWPALFEKLKETLAKSSNSFKFMLEASKFGQKPACQTNTFEDFSEELSELALSWINQGMLNYV